MGTLEYDVQDLILKRHNIRYLLAEYVTAEGRTITRVVTCGAARSLWSNPQSVCAVPALRLCRVPQPLIVEQLREFGIEISTGQVNRLLTEEKADFHTERAVSVASGFRDS